MALLELKGLTKRFGSFVALDAFDLEAARGEVHCLLGENGAGKSTLCNLIFGVHRPDGGTMTFNAQPFTPSGPIDALRKGISMVHQHFSLVPTMTVVENMMMGRTGPILHRHEAVERMSRLAAEYQLEIDPWRVVNDLSVGERQRVEIIKCLLVNPQLLILDEPTAVLPPEEVDSLLSLCRQIADNGRSILLVTHKLAEIAKVADRTSVLRQGRLVKSVSMNDVDMLDLVRAMIGHDIETSDGVLAATLGIGAQSQANGDAKPRARPASTLLPPDLGTQATLKLKNISYRDDSGVSHLDGISLSVEKYEIVGLAGVEGNGQSELGAILAGLIKPTEGTMSIDGIDLTSAAPQAITDCGVGIIPEDRHAVAVISDLSVSENMCLGSTDRFTRFGLLDRTKMNREMATLMNEFDVRTTNPLAPMSSLSGGNQQKAVLARELSRPNLKFLLAAQPTRGLDVGAVESVYSRIQAARDNGLGVLMISSELSELIAVADRVAVIYRGKIVGEMSASAENREAIGAMMSGHSDE